MAQKGAITHFLMDGQKINMGYTYPKSIQSTGKYNTKPPNILRNKALQFTANCTI